MFEFNSLKFLINKRQIKLVVKHVIEIKRIFFIKIAFGKQISKFLKFKDRRIQIIKLTIPEESIIPITPKLQGDKLPKLLTGAPSKNQSKKTLKIIPAKDN